MDYSSIKRLVLGHKTPFHFQCSNSKPFSGHEQFQLMIWFYVDVCSHSREPRKASKGLPHIYLLSNLPGLSIEFDLPSKLHDVILSARHDMD